MQPNSKHVQHNQIVVSEDEINNKTFQSPKFQLSTFLKVKGSGVGKGSDPIKGSFFVYVADMCGGKSGDVDLFGTGDGRWQVQIQAVQCPVGNTPLEYKFQGANEWSLKLQIRNHR